MQGSSCPLGMLSYLLPRILRDKSFAKMNDQDWDLVYKVHVYGAFKVTKAAWEVFQRQQYGRIIMTSSAAGLYGNYGQTNYGSAKMALVGFGKTLAREGAKKNIYCNVIAPVAGSRITETVLPQEMIEKLRPDYVAPFVAYLCHESCPENGSVYEVGAGFAAKVRWERSRGSLLKVDHQQSFTPSAVAAKLSEGTSFASPQYPQSMGDVDWVGLLKASQSLSIPKNEEASPPLRFDGKIALITGAGGGLGKAYALMFGRLGAHVVVNDLGRDKEGGRLADAVVKAIEAQGGKASSNFTSVEEGDKIISQIVSQHGRIDIIVNNAGILRDKSFAKMSEEEWNIVLAVHLRGTFAICKAAWPHMLKQRYGRIINTCSAVGLYGNFGQANYSCAKAGILGFSNSLAAEGARNNVLVNTIAPNAGTQMTATILPMDVVDVLKPDYVAPLVGYLAHEGCKVNGGIFEVGSGWFSQVRWQRSPGHKLETASMTLEEVARNWHHFGKFEGNVAYPKNAQESFSSIAELISDTHGSGGLKPSNKSPKPSSSSIGNSFTFSKRDVMLYNLGVGCAEDESKYVYEGDPNFAAIPTFAVIPAFVIMMDTRMADYVNGFNPTMLLHGEHYLELPSLIPVEGTLRSERRVLQVLPKGKSGCIVVLQLKTMDEGGNTVAINEGTIFLRGATPKQQINQASERQPLATYSVTIPDRQPDRVISQKIPSNQAAIYRLSGDYNPLHIDRAFAQMGGFPRPILHGLCTYGHAAKHVLKAFANDDPARFKAIKARFTKHVFPGETIQTEMWRIDQNKIAFQVRALERNEIVIGNAFVELHPESTASGTKVSSGASQVPSASKSKAAALFSRFETIYNGLPPAMKEDQVKKVNGIFQFDIKQENGSGEQYHIDLKTGMGKIGRGPAQRPDITIIVKDDDFALLASGQLNGQQAFMKGQVQVRGNMIMAMKLDRVLKTLSGNTKSKI